MSRSILDSHILTVAKTDQKLNDHREALTIGSVTSIRWADHSMLLVSADNPRPSVTADKFTRFFTAVKANQK